MSHHQHGSNHHRSRKDHVMAARELPTPEALRKLLKYEPETGKFYWKCGNRAWKQAFTYINKLGYHVSNFNGYVVLGHRAAWAVHYGEWPNVIDHINGDKTDNSILNLRNVTQAENTRNRAMDRRNKTGHIGVSYDDVRKKFTAYISRNGKRVSLGRFDALEDARSAREAAALAAGYPETHGRAKTIRSA